MDESPVSEDLPWPSHLSATNSGNASNRSCLNPSLVASGSPGEKPLDYRKVLTGIIFVLKTGIPWEELPQEMGCGCGMTCLNYLNAWQWAGVWEKLHQILLGELEQADKLDWSRVAWIVPRPEPWGAAIRPAPIRRIEANPGPSTMS